ncbi:MAG TPA: hypothetical protein VFI30_00100 [Nocardioidaceae bacterium]|nr:hypothetical protein [Nocardioidaceae bacterium]
MTVTPSTDPAVDARVRSRRFFTRGEVQPRRAREVHRVPGRGGEGPAHRAPAGVGHGSVVTTGGTARKTYRKRGSVGVLLARGPGVDRWSVTDYQAMKKPLKGC